MIDKQEWQDLLSVPGIMEEISARMEKNKLDKSDHYKNCVDELLSDKNNIDVNKVDKDGYTLLMRLSTHGDIDLVSNILTHPNINVRIKTKVGTALSNAACLGHLEIAQMLVKKDACHEHLEEGCYMSPLLLAVQQKHVEVVQFLLDNGARALAKNKEGQNAFAIVDTFNNNKADNVKCNNIIKILNPYALRDYIENLSKRSDTGTWNALKRSYNFFCCRIRPAGFSVLEKSAASKALLKVINLKEDLSALAPDELATLAPHLDALQNGKLGEIFKRYVRISPNFALDSILQAAESVARAAQSGSKI